MYVLKKLDEAVTALTKPEAGLKEQQRAVKLYNAFLSSMEKISGADVRFLFIPLFVL